MRAALLGYRALSTLYLETFSAWLLHCVPSLSLHTFSATPLTLVSAPGVGTQALASWMRKSGSLLSYIWSGFFFCLYLHVNILEGKNDRLLAQSQFALHITSLPISLKKKKDVFLHGGNKPIFVVVKKMYKIHTKICSVQRDFFIRWDTSESVLSSPATGALAHLPFARSSCSRSVPNLLWEHSFMAKRCWCWCCWQWWACHPAQCSILYPRWNGTRECWRQNSYCMISTFIHCLHLNKLH